MVICAEVTYNTVVKAYRKKPLAIVLMHEIDAYRFRDIDSRWKEEPGPTCENMVAIVNSGGRTMARVGHMLRLLTIPDMLIQQKRTYSSIVTYRATRGVHTVYWLMSWHQKR
jgi:hypothetical protein